MNIEALDINLNLRNGGGARARDNIFHVKVSFLNKFVTFF